MRISDWSSDVCSSDLSIECFKPAGLRSKDSALVKLSNSRPPFSFRDNLILLPRTCASFRLLPVAIKHLSQRYPHLFSLSPALGQKSQPHHLACFRLNPQQRLIFCWGDHLAQPCILGGSSPSG